MANSISCSACSYPIASVPIGSEIRCPSCHTTGIATRISGPSPENVGWLFIGLFAGTILGSTIKEGIEAGKRAAETRLKKIGR